jgi:hypothetical protein
MKTIAIQIKYRHIEGQGEGETGKHRYTFNFIAPEGHLEIVPVEFAAPQSRNAATDRQARRQFKQIAQDYGSNIKWIYESLKVEKKN